jgi:ATP-binding cassette subfamily B protein
MTSRLHEEEEVFSKAYDSGLAKRLLGYLAPYRHVVVLSVLILLAVSISELAGPYLVKVAIDRYIARGDASGLLLLALLYALSLGAAFVLRYWQVYLTNRTGQQVMADLRMEIFTHLQRLPVPFFDRNPVGRLLTRVTNDVEVLNEMVTSGVVTIFGDIFTLIGIAVVLTYLDRTLALVVFAVVPFMLMAAMVFRRKARIAYSMTRARIARLNAYLQESLGGMRIVQAFVRERRSAAQFDRLNASHLEAYLRSVLYHSVFFPAMELIGAVAIALIIWHGGSGVIKGTLTIGGLVAFLQYTQRFFRPVTDLSEKYNTMQAAMSSAERIFDLLDTRPEADDSEDAVRVTAARGEVEFENVTFAYDRGEEVLRGVSFKVGRGETVAIVGATGAGKTTLMSLLARFYELENGSIKIDGVDIRNVARQDLRRNVAIVPQDIFLFSGTIEENLTLGRPGIGAARVEDAARRVGADDFIRRLPHGYQEEVGERGVSLSVGQRQLVSFARALIHDPRILILDEATSSVDPETEYLLREAVHSLLAGRTSIVIAHRLSTIRSADRIVVLHKGKVKEEGTHEELLKTGGTYSKLWELQYMLQGNDD